MKISNITLFITVIIIASCTRDVVVPDSINNCDEGVIYFERDLVPIIISNCATTGCHADKNPEDGIRLHNVSAILRTVNSGNPEKSGLYKYLTGVVSPDDEDAMPPSPNTPLTSDQISEIYTWIKEGAVLYECTAPCEVGEVSFNQNVTPIIQKYCVGCHSSSNSSGNVRLDKFSKIKEYALNGQLMGTINHENGFSIMPPGSSKVDPCDTQSLQKWIDEGALEN